MKIRLELREFQSLEVPDKSRNEDVTAIVKDKYPDYRIDDLDDDQVWLTKEEPDFTSKILALVKATQADKDSTMDIFMDRLQEILKGG